MPLPSRSEADLQERQRRGDLRVLSAADYRALVARVGVEEAFGATDVVVAANAEFTDHASLRLSLGPADPPIRIRDFRLGGVGGQGGHGGSDLVLPIGVLVWFMSEGWSGNYAAFWSTIAMVGVSLLRRRTRMGWRTILESLANAGHTMAPLAVSIAGSGIVVSALTTTGLVVALGGIIKVMAAGSFPLLLLLLAATVLVLGMGIPTTPSYIIAAAIGVPQILELGQVALGVPQAALVLPAHLFIFYFAVLADASPPVAAAAFAAAAIAKASPLVSSLHATRLGIAGFTVGFAFLYDPAIMWRGSWYEIALVVAIQASALAAIAAGYAGYLRAPLGWLPRLMLGAAGLFAAFYHAVPDLVRLAVAGGALVGIALLQQLRSKA